MTTKVCIPSQSSADIVAPAKAAGLSSSCAASPLSAAFLGIVLVIRVRTPRAAASLAAPSSSPQLVN